MSDTKAAKVEILRDLDRSIVNMESLEHKQLTRSQRDEIVWALKIMRVARKAISETLSDTPPANHSITYVDDPSKIMFHDAEGRN